MNFLKSKKVGLIVGGSGQDGQYLTSLLTSKKYTVYSTSRCWENARTEKLATDFSKVIRLDLDPANEQLVAEVIERVKPDEIYLLAGQSSVSLSFSQPLITIDSHVKMAYSFLSSILMHRSQAKIFVATSGEIFGNVEDCDADENTPFNPMSPYGIAKTSVAFIAKYFKEHYGLHVSTGILFNHESELRPPKFVTRKIIDSAILASQKPDYSFELGNLNVFRDWGHASEYVEAMWLILQQESPDTYVIGTGSTNSLQDFLNNAFRHFGLEATDHVKINSELFRSNDIKINGCCPMKIKTKLGWEAKIQFNELVERLIYDRKKYC